MSTPFRILHFGFRFSGLMIDKGRPWSLIGMLYHCFIVASFITFSVLELCLGSGNLIDRIEAMSGLAICVITFPKVFTFIRRGKEIRNLCNRLEDIHSKVLKESENRIFLIKAENLGKKFIIILASFELSTPILLFLSTTFYDYFTNFENKRFTVQIWIPWSVEEVWAYILAKMYASLMTLTCCCAVTLFASVEFTFTFYISALLKVLQNYLETRGADDSIYRYHNILIQLINDYNGIFSGAMYVETLVSPLMPCGFGLTLIRSLRMSKFNQLGDALPKIFGCMLPPFITCSCGHEIITQVERLHESSYMSNWYEVTPKVRRDLLTLMIRTTKPTTINYRIFITYDRVCLATVCQGLYSYFMMIINFDSA